MSEMTIPDGWRRYELGEVRAIGDRFCDPSDHEDFARIENWGKVYPYKDEEVPLVADFIYIKPVAKSFVESMRKFSAQTHDEKFLESLRKFAAQIDAMIRNIKERL